MGYRLNAYNEDKTINFYGTKHYGYSFVNKDDGIKYPSYRYLLEIKKLNGEEIFDYGCSPQITLTAKQFEHFIQLYAKEWEENKEHYPDWRNRTLLDEKEIVKLLESEEKKIITWW